MPSLAQTLIIRAREWEGDRRTRRTAAHIRRVLGVRSGRAVDLTEEQLTLVIRFVEDQIAKEGLARDRKSA